MSELEINAENWRKELMELLNRRDRITTAIRHEADAQYRMHLKQQLTTINILLGKILGCCEFNPNASIPKPGFGLTTPSRDKGLNNDERIAQNAILIRGLNVWQQPQRN